LNKFDVIIIGAGAAGLMCAIEAGKRGRSVLLLDHTKKLGEKIRISGGGRCNFTNLVVSPENFLSNNRRFCISALKRFNQHDFISLVQKHDIAYHEKTLGQLFCNESSRQIIDMLLVECAEAKVTIQTETTIKTVSPNFLLKTDQGNYKCSSLVIATGGLSIPKIGATGFGYNIARQFKLKVIPPRAGLVALTFEDYLCRETKKLAGISVDAKVETNSHSFSEALLFTHKGLSGPAILQISSYWINGQEIVVDLAPNMDIFELLKSAKHNQPKQEPAKILSRVLPKRLAQLITTGQSLEIRLAEISDENLKKIAVAINNWQITPKGNDGYRTAEVTLGGIDTQELSSKTFEAKKVPGLYFIGEVVDVTGHLGGFNFQWAWSSGHAAGQFV
jgi:predicted Rossmann fold flavoprotein